MAKVWKILALLLVITTLVWLTTLWRWQSNQIDPSGTAIVVYLVVLPVLLTAALVGAVWGVGRMRRYAAAPIVPASSSKAAPAAGAQAPAAGSAAERHTHFTLLWATAQTRAGKAWNAACQAIAKGECKPDLDPELKDDEGLPVFTAPFDDVDTAVIAEQLEALAERRAPADPNGPWAGYQCPDEVVRALAMIEMCVGESFESLEMQWPALGGLRLPDAGRPPGNAAVKVPTAVVRIGLPARWPEPARQLAVQWIEQLLDPVVDAGLQAAGQTRAMAQNTRAAVQVHVHPVESAEAFWRLIDQQLVQWQRDGEAGLLLALVADSHLSPAEVDRWQSRGELFSGQQQNGRVPGEGAAALLLASPAWPKLPDALPPMAWLHRAGVFERQKSADAAGRISADTLQQAMADTLKAAHADASALSHITTDADHRASRTGEVFQALQELAPQIDPMEQVLRLGAGCGDLGIARLAVATALAAAQVAESDEPGLVLGTFDPLARLALLVTPPRAPAAPDTAAADPAAA